MVAELKQRAEPVITRQYTGRRVETEDAISVLPLESQAALRQYSLERMMGYGVNYSDAVELRASVLGKGDWQRTATELAERCLLQAENAAPLARVPTKVAYLRRASALLRISQSMMLTDTDERRQIFARAAGYFEDAGELAGDCRPVVVDSENGPLAGWLYEASAPAVASVIVIGGVEGWAMDFSSLGTEFASRGMDALLLDAPGQGQTRFAHGHYLSQQWRKSYFAVVDLLEGRAPGRPIGIIGNSMGGSFAMAVANADKRIRACCNNGGPIAPWMVPKDTTFFSKMMAFAGTHDQNEATKTWSTVTPVEAAKNENYPLLLVHGGEDPLVSNAMADMLFDKAPTHDKKMVIFSDGDHCIYRHTQDRDILISDWMRSRLA